MVNGWIPTSLGEILRLEKRPVKLIPDQEYAEIGVYSYGRGIFHKRPRTGFEVGDKDLFEIKSGDFIFQITFAWEGAIALASEAEDGMYGSVRFPTYRVNEDICDPKFLLNYFKTEEGRREVGRISPGSAGRNRVLATKRLPEIKVPLPPLTEQRRIVAHIESLEARVNEAQRLREEADIEANSLERSLIDKVYKSCVEQYGTIELANVCDSITDGDHITPKFEENGVKFIFVGNVSSGFLHFRNCKYVLPEYFAKVRPQRKAQLGDILYSAVGATLGVPAIVDKQEDFCFQRHIAIIKPNREKLDPKFLWYVMRSATIFDFAWANTTGSAQPTVPLNAIRKFPVVVPPLDEQRRIVAYLDGLQAKVNALRELQVKGGEELSALMPSILDKAFKGEL